MDPPAPRLVIEFLSGEITRLELTAGLFQQSPESLVGLDLASLSAEARDGFAQYAKMLMAAEGLMSFTTSEHHSVETTQLLKARAAALLHALMSVANVASWVL